MLNPRDRQFAQANQTEPGNNYIYASDQELARSYLPKIIQINMEFPDAFKTDEEITRADDANAKFEEIQAIMFRNSIPLLGVVCSFSFEALNTIASIYTKRAMYAEDACEDLVYAKKLYEFAYNFHKVHIHKIHSESITSKEKQDNQVKLGTAAHNMGWINSRLAAENKELRQDVIKYYTEAVELRTQIYPDGHLDLAKSQGNLSAAYRAFIKAFPEKVNVEFLQYAALSLQYGYLAIRGYQNAGKDCTTFKNGLESDLDSLLAVANTVVATKGDEATKKGLITQIARHIRDLGFDNVDFIALAKQVQPSANQNVQATPAQQLSSSIAQQNGSSVVVRAVNQNFSSSQPSVGGAAGVLPAKIQPKVNGTSATSLRGNTVSVTVKAKGEDSPPSTPQQNNSRSSNSHSISNLHNFTEAANNDNASRKVPAMEQETQPKGCLGCL